MTRKELALEKRAKGYNCAQAVLCAFCDKINMDENTALNLSEGFGGGIGGTHNICGAVTGMLMAANLILGSASTDNPSATKSDSYKRTRELLNSFKELNTTYICSELLGDSSRPKIRSCNGCVEDAVEILEKYIEENK